MNNFTLPFGTSSITIQLPGHIVADQYLPIELHPTAEQTDAVITAIRNPLNGFGIPSGLGPKTKVAISINDKTRPVPNNILFPPLLDALIKAGVIAENITIIIATGTHQPMVENEYSLLLSNDVWQRHQMCSHDCDLNNNFTYKGTTSRETPVYINSIFDQADLKIVVGDIEPHHFAGFSGGYKSASIGLCGRKTINANHAFLQDPKSCVGHFEDNPLRQDIEEIGQLIGVDLALNAILNEKREILHVFFGKPNEVFEAGIEVIRKTSLIQIREPYDLVIASAGGYPKDINLYQAQKALTHASLFCKDGGTVLLAAECVEGVGSQAYVDFMQGVENHTEAKEKLNSLGFRVGPHKAFQFAAIADRVHFAVKCSIPDEMMSHLLIKPIVDFNFEIQAFLNSRSSFRIAIVPFATATIPIIDGGIFYEE
mgnify:FL=1